MPHPKQLVIMLPVYATREYRRYIAALDDTLVVRIGPEGRFEFELRPMVRFTPRTYAGLITTFAVDLEAGSTVMLVDRDDYLASIESPAWGYSSAKERETVERAIAIIKERAPRQVIDHLCGDDAEHRISRAMVAARPRRTRPGKFDRRNKLSFVHGIPTPRAELLWHTLRSEWCDVRMAQHGYCAWRDWIGRNRPNLPRSDVPIAEVPF